MDYKEFMPEPQILIGIDFGQSRDHSAISVIERLYVPTSELYNAEVYQYLDFHAFLNKTPSGSRLRAG